jgi:prepilin-type N-terminal cleavage/methylation domain-containing protein
MFQSCRQKLRKGFIQHQAGVGFTLIELLVVIAIIGLLSSMIMLSLSSSRLKARDAKRLTDMNQIRSGLDIYYNTGGGYPDPTAWIQNQILKCNGTEAFIVPNDVVPGYSYNYYVNTTVGNHMSGCGGDVWDTYEIEFTTEGTTNLGPAGTYYLSPGGITPSPPFSTTTP